MIKTLYEKFQDWSKTGSIYIYSDTHFEDSDCKLMDPNWISPEEQINIINKLVHKNDTLILLGDVGNVEWIKKLKAGYKVLITGNHDAGAENYKRKKYTVFTNGRTIKELKNRYKDLIYIDNEDFYPSAYCDNKLFDEVYTGPLMISDKIILSHEPIPNIKWALNIHGHDHGGKGGHLFLGNYYNVCSNTINYTPINLKDIINSGVLKDIDSLHRITIDKATEHPIKKK